MRRLSRCEGGEEGQVLEVCIFIPVAIVVIV